MDRPSAKQMERGSASEMDRKTKCQKNETATKKNLLHILVPVQKNVT